jgi:hypothetical protein
MARTNTAANALQIFAGPRARPRLLERGLPRADPLL